MSASQYRYTVSSDYDDTQREDRKNLRLCDDNSVTKIIVVNIILVIMYTSYAGKIRGVGFISDMTIYLCLAKWRREAIAELMAT